MTASEISAAIEGNDVNGNKTRENLDLLVNQKAGKVPQPAVAPSQQHVGLLVMFLTFIKVDIKMKEEAKKIGEQLNGLIAAKQPEAIALQALCATIR